MTKAPKSIRWFSLLLLAAAALELANNLWLLRAVGRLGGQNMDLLIGALLPPLIVAILWFAIVRWWSVIAKWLLIAFIVIRLGFIGYALVVAGAAALKLSFLVAVAVELMKAVAAAFLFRPDAKAFFVEDVR